MKKISYSLRIGFIGKMEQLKEIFLENLMKSAIKSNFSDDYYEYLIVFRQIPIKIKVFIHEKLENLIYKFEKIRKLDILIITINLYESESLRVINKILIEEFNETYSFQGLSILVGMNIEQIFSKTPSRKFKISRFQLEKTTKDLKFLYCFEIFNKDKDINEIYEKILNDYILRFQYSNPELFETAKEYGKSLLS